MVVLEFQERQAWIVGKVHPVVVCAEVDVMELVEVDFGQPSVLYALAERMKLFRKVSR